LSGTNLSLFNSFVVLDDEDIISRALEMGVEHSSLSFEFINSLKDLEIARHKLADMEKGDGNEVVDQREQVEYLEWRDGEEEDVEFTPVISRKNKKKRKSVGNVKKCQGKLNAAAVKVNNYHPMSDVVTRTRERKKIP